MTQYPAQCRVGPRQSLDANGVLLRIHQRTIKFYLRGSCGRAPYKRGSLRFGQDHLLTGSSYLEISVMAQGGQFP